MKKNRLILIIIVIVAIIALIITGFIMLNNSNNSINRVNNKSNTNTIYDFATNKDVKENVTTDSNGLLINNSSEFNKKHTYQSYTINNFELIQDKDNKNMVHAKFKVDGNSPYKRTGISFTFIFSDGTKSKTYHTFVDSLNDTIDYTILDRVIDSIDYEFTIYEFSEEADG